MFSLVNISIDFSFNFSFNFSFDSFFDSSIDFPFRFSIRFFIRCSIWFSIRFIIRISIPIKLNVLRILEISPFITRPNGHNMKSILIYLQFVTLDANCCSKRCCWINAHRNLSIIQSAVHWKFHSCFDARIYSFGSQLANRIVLGYIGHECPICVHSIGIDRTNERKKNWATKWSLTLNSCK